MNFFQAIDDYFLPFDTAIYFRLIRYFALFLTLFLPAIYVAIISFHPDMIPTQYLISVAAQRHSVPFAPILEISIMEGTFEIIFGIKHQNAKASRSNNFNCWSTSFR